MPEDEEDEEDDEDDEYGEDDDEEASMEKEDDEDDDEEASMEKEDDEDDDEEQDEGKEKEEDDEDDENDEAVDRGTGDVSSEEEAENGVDVRLLAPQRYERKCLAIESTSGCSRGLSSGGESVVKATALNAARAAWSSSAGASTYLRN
jgi:hypothetical protein